MESEEFCQLFEERCSDTLRNVSEAAQFLEDERKDIIDKIGKCEDKKEKLALRRRISKVCRIKNILELSKSSIKDCADMAENGFVPSEDIKINTTLFKIKKKREREDFEENMRKTEMYFYKAHNISR